MEQKTIWMHCLIIGISLCLINCSSNQLQIDYAQRVDLCYINETNFVLQIKTSNANTETLVISPFSKNNVSIDGGGAHKNPNVETCCQGYLEDRQGDYFQVHTIINDSSCVFYKENEGLTSLMNYKGEQIGNRHFKFTYTFTEKDFEHTVKCSQ